MSKEKVPAVFLDRDGVLIYDPGYLRKKDQIKLLKGIENLTEFQNNGFILIIVANQSAVARGVISEEQMWELDRYTRNLLDEKGVKITGSFYCPHHPEFTGECNCRKPKPGLLSEAIKKFNIDPKRSFVVGDKLRDLQAGFSARVKYGILVKTNQKEWGIEDEDLQKVKFKADGIVEALEIMKKELGYK